MSAPKTAFASFDAETQAQIRHLLSPMIGGFTYDLRFDEDGPYIVSASTGYTLEELRTWSGVSRYFGLSTEEKRRVLKLIEQNPISYVGLIFTAEGALYNTVVDDLHPGILWDEAHSSQEWLRILGLDGPDAPSGDSILSLEIDALEGEYVDTGEDLSAKYEALRKRFQSLEADMRGTMKMNQELREKLEAIATLLK